MAATVWQSHEVTLFCSNTAEIGGNSGEIGNLDIVTMVHAEVISLGHKGVTAY